MRTLEYNMEKLEKDLDFQIEAIEKVNLKYVDIFESLQH
jgi:hypothetical protein